MSSLLVSSSSASTLLSFLDQMTTRRLLKPIQLFLDKQIPLSPSGDCPCWCSWCCWCCRHNYPRANDKSKYLLGSCNLGSMLFIKLSRISGVSAPLAPSKTNTKYWAGFQNGKILGNRGIDLREDHPCGSLLVCRFFSQKQMSGSGSTTYTRRKGYTLPTAKPIFWFSQAWCHNVFCLWYSRNSCKSTKKVRINKEYLTHG